MLCPKGRVHAAVCFPFNLGRLHAAVCSSFHLGRLPAAALLLSSVSTAAFAQGAGSPPPENLPGIVVTATKTETPLANVGSAISVITAEDIQRSPISSTSSFDDIFRQVPGIQLTQAGGPGQPQVVRIRGAEDRHTLVLIDGIRVNDPSLTGRSFDFANLVLSDIERIEVLRGPQSALYGSDAIGGVINVITRKGQNGPPRVTLSTEAGSYGTSETRGAISGGDGTVDYALGFNLLNTAGFSTYGYRIRRLAYQSPVLNGSFEPDSALRYGVSGRFGINITDGVRVEFGASTSSNRVQYDQAFFDPVFSPFPDTASRADSSLSNVYGKLIVDALDGRMTNTLTVFANRTDRAYRSISYDASGFGIYCGSTFFLGSGLQSCDARSRFIGERVGAEYQGDLRLGSFGTLTFGGRYERETADSFAGTAQPYSPTTRTIAAEQDTRSAYIQHQFTLGERLSVTLGGRIDDVVSPGRYFTGVAGDGDRAIDQFVTGRLAVAYNIPETGTKLRMSAGTGGKTPALYQLFDPTYGTPTLQSEHSVGLDAGIDQTLFDDRLKFSFTAFTNKLENLIDFATSANCGPGQVFGCYFNVANAHTEGLELEAQARLIPDFLTMRAAYTHIDARDDATGFKLARRPVEQGRIGFVFTPIPKLSVEPAIVLVGQRFSSNAQTDRLPAYARLDLYADYRLDETYSVFARAQNITGTRYEEVKNYGTAGAAVFGGIRATW